jgi:hypothetical protein
MKRWMLFLAAALALINHAHSQEKLKWTLFLHQTGMYYSSDNITSDGFGFGLGVHLLHKSQIAGQADLNILWGNGNAVSTRLALGYEKKGTWTPGLYGTFNLIWGQRVELLSETGEKPPMPAWAAGIRVTPLKFQTKLGYVSALEFGYGFGPEKGMSLEFSMLSVGIRF